MTGCFDNFGEDRIRERELNRYLDEKYKEEIEVCVYCGLEKETKLSCCGERHFEIINQNEEE